MGVKGKTQVGQRDILVAHQQTSRITVVAGVIIKNGLVLVAKKAGGELAGKWEFPGGKVEPGETLEESLARELMEELSIDVSVKRRLNTTLFDYSHVSIELNTYLCEIKYGELQGNGDHMEILFVPWSRLKEMDLADADRIAVEKINDSLGEDLLLNVLGVVW
ncbi:MAG: (deoxy)nucleoside triphosphate pyrophosphohydrolase [Deltaproteobacteria bacterium]|nr:(deoxy)nucleoside triphosphate pyrophosphohydrolase [Deltaproteobacteria bacterium]